MQVPLLDLKAQYQTIKEEVKAAIDDVLESQYFILGPKTKSLEEKIAEYSNCKHAIGVASGSDALLVSLMALDINPGDEVITTPYTFFATGGSISRLGAKPVFVDIDIRTYNINPELIEAQITPKTKAIIPVHLFGQCAEMDMIMEIANRHGIPVIEDAAQSIGAIYKEKKAGSIGMLGCFSFFPSKNLGGYGDGGMIVTNDDKLADRIRLLRVHGSRPKYFHSVIGLNSRLDALQSAVLEVKLSHLDKWSAGRRANAEFYNDKFKDVPAIVTPYIEPYNVSIYNQYVIRVPERDALMQHLKDNNIGCEVYYPLSLHMQECFADLGYKEGSFPLSEKAAKESVAIPVYPELTIEQKDYIAKMVIDFVNK